MSEQARAERAFLRYVYQDDPDKLKRELEAFDRQYGSDPYADWWVTSTGAKVERLIAFELRRLCQAHPGTTIGIHGPGLKSVLFAMERSIDEAEYEEMLAQLPYRKEFGDAWLATARLLKETFPAIDFAYGQADAIQAFLNPADPAVKLDAFRAPGKYASVLAAWAVWKDTVAQEPRRAPAGERGPDEDLREANNLWRSWLAYTEVLEKKWPAVLEAALLDLGVLRRRSVREGNPFHLVRERKRRTPPASPKFFMELSFDEDSIGCVNVDDALYQVVHWFDYLVENGRLPALPPLPRIPTAEEAALDPVRTVNGLAAMIEKRVYQALGLDRDRYYRADLGVRISLAALPRIRTPGLDVPDYVRERADYDAWRRCGLLAPIQYLVTLKGLPRLKTLGPGIFKALHLALDLGMHHATYGMSWEVAPFVFAGQAHDEVELREDLTYLDAYLAKHAYRYVPPEPTNREQRSRALQPLRIGFHVFRGESLAACEAQLGGVSPHLDFLWEGLRPGDVIQYEGGSALKVGE